MEEIKTKKAKPGKKTIGKDRIMIKKTRVSCSCGCLCSSSSSKDSVDADGALNSALDNGTDTCGCLCGANADVDNIVDSACES